MKDDYMHVQIALFDGFDPLDAIAPFEVPHAGAWAGSTRPASAPSPPRTTRARKRYFMSAEIEGVGDLTIGTPIGRVRPVVALRTEDGLPVGTPHGDTLTGTSKAGHLSSSKITGRRRSDDVTEAAGQAR